MVFVSYFKDIEYSFGWIGHLSLLLSTCDTLPIKTLGKRWGPCVLEI